MKKPAARIGDMHNCPLVSPGGVPHGGGPIVGPGCATVWIDGAPAATAGDTCLCVGGLDKIVTGSTGVFIEGREAARQGDRCEHGGVVIGGSGSVFIGEGVVDVCFSKPDAPVDKVNNNELIEPPPEERSRIINQAIKECIFLLERKLQLLQQRDSKTMDEFKKWFGLNNEGAVELIVNRIAKAIQISKILTIDNFEVIADEFAREKYYAFVRGSDEFYTFYLGYPFWKDGIAGISMAGTLIHELSHFNDIGCTSDFEYGVDQCLHISKHESIKALYNAENFEFFIKA